jgi:hypothetical protein
LVGISGGLIALVSQAITVSVRLVTIGIVGTVVTDVATAVKVSVCLVMVLGRVERTVVLLIRNAVPICIVRRRALGTHENEDPSQ